MEIKDIFKELDERASYMAPGHLRRWLTGQIEEYSSQHQDDPEGLCALYNEVGAIHKNAGEYDKAEEAFMTAKQLLETDIETELSVNGSFAEDGEDVRSKQAININGSESPELATTLSNLAEIYRLTGRADEAMKALTRAEEIYDLDAGTVPPELFCGVLIDKSALLMAKEEFDPAFDSLAKALEYACNREKKNFSLIGTIFYNLGRAMEGLNGPQQASELYGKGAEWFKAASGEDSEGYKQCMERIEALK